MSVVLAPVAGLVRPLAEVPDPVFSAEMVGAGVAVEPTGGPGEAVSPVAGTVVTLHPHAFVVRTPEGTGLLVHLGIDTVRLGGAGFEPLVEVQAVVDAGQPVTRWDPTDVAARGLSPLVMVCVLDTRAGAVTSERTGSRVAAGEALFTWPPPGPASAPA
ncbi:PTS glucose transporter subunit IIA [Fodinibacter luteus]|uniref:PTS glucose transporter subunit IIA n=1 Tax=Fodinibacter luteus TaxID=552064 RepID=A0ABP8KMF5_9MICO